MEQLRKRHGEELEKYNSYNKDQQKYIEFKKQVGGQLNEIEAVLEELKILHPEKNAVYKAIGPVLIKQDLKEAVENVKKRRTFCNEQLKKNDDALRDLDNKRKGHEESLKKIEHQIQQIQLKAAVK